MPLAEGLETERQPELEPYKAQAKALVKKLAQQGGGSGGGRAAAPTRLSVESGPFCFQCVSFDAAAARSLCTCTDRASLVRACACALAVC